MVGNDIIDALLLNENLLLRFSHINLFKSLVQISHEKMLIRAENSPSVFIV